MVCPMNVLFVLSGEEKGGKKTISMTVTTNQYFFNILFFSVFEKLNGIKLSQLVGCNLFPNSRQQR